MKAILCIPIVKCYENEYGVHLKCIVHEQLKPIPDDSEVSRDELKDIVGSYVGTITFHVKTNSCSIDNAKLNPMYTPNDLAKELVKVLKSDAGKGIVKRAGIEDYKFKPVWSKQLERHFV